VEPKKTPKNKVKLDQSKKITEFKGKIVHKSCQTEKKLDLKKRAI
jgi:hypothetical protein